VSVGERSDVVILDDVTCPPDAAGVGALLMTDPNLPKDEFGHPYQALYWFDGRSRALGLLLDDDEHVLAWVNNGHGDPDVEVRPMCQRVPEAVERAARHWWSNQSGG
jgi:hypothetical protein